MHLSSTFGTCILLCSGFSSFAEAYLIDSDGTEARACDAVEDAAEHDANTLFQSKVHIAEDAMTATSRKVTQPAGGSLKETFDGIADSNMWGSSETVSGKGSKMDMTAGVRQCLGQWLLKYKAKVFVDVPCGDANWQAGIPGIHDIVYKGYDIADTPIKTARAKNLHFQAMSFDQLDLTAQVPPIQADIILVRDVIQHLPLDKGKQMLLNAKKSGAKFLAVTTFSDGVNKNISAGSFYQNNVHSSPFNLPAAVESCKNYDEARIKLDFSAIDGNILATDFLELIDLSTWNHLE